MNNKIKNIAIVLMSAIAMYSCEINPIHRNIREYIEEYVTDPSVISKIEYGEPDSVLTDIRFGFEYRELLSAESDYYDGKISLDSVEELLFICTRDLYNIRTSLDNRPNIKCLKSNKEYADEWRAVYPVTITYKDGHSNKFEILMDNDGITPRMTTDEYRLQLHQHDLDLQSTKSTISL